MKYTYIILAATLAFSACCNNKTPEVDLNKSLMIMDSTYHSDANVIIVKPKDKIYLIEEMKYFEMNPNITQADIDVMDKKVMKDIDYVTKGERLKLSEK